MNRKVIAVSKSINDEINNNVKNHRNEKDEIMKDYYLSLVISRSQESLEKLALHYEIHMRDLKTSHDDLIADFIGLPLLYALDKWDEEKGDFLAYWQVCIYTELIQQVRRCKADVRRANYNNASNIVKLNNNVQSSLFDTMACDSHCDYEEVELTESLKKIVNEFSENHKDGQMIFFELLGDDLCKANWITYMGRTYYDGAVRQRRKRILDKFRLFITEKGYNEVLFSK